jgi:BASS family bile acid:Na+ symporter
LLLAQLIAMLALPVAVGMGIRHRWPGLAERHRKLVQQIGFGAIAVVLAIVIASEAPRFVGGLLRTVPVALAFILLSMLAGRLVSVAIGTTPSDRFTLVAEFGTRNVAIATAIAVTLLGRLEFAVFAATCFLTGIPVMLAAIAVFRLSQRR